MTDVPHINKAKAAIKHAFRNQIDGKGFSLVELISTCPSNWKMSPLESIEYAKNEMMKIYPLGVYKDIDKEAE